MFKSNGNNIFQNKKRGIPVFLVKLRAKPTTITWGSDVVLRGHFPGRRSWRGSSRFYRLSPGNRVRSTASPIYMGESWWTLGYHRTRQFPPTSRHPLTLKKGHCTFSESGFPSSWQGCHVGNVWEMEVISFWSQEKTVEWHAAALLEADPFQAWMFHPEMIIWYGMDWYGGIVWYFHVFTVNLLLCSTATADSWIILHADNVYIL